VAGFTVSTSAFRMSVIPPMLHIHSFLSHLRHIILTTIIVVK